MASSVNRTIGSVVVIPAVIALCAWTPWEREVLRSTVTSTSAVQGNQTVYEFTVTAAAGETIKDFHVLPMPGSKYRPKGVPQSNSTGTGGPWTASGGTGGFHWATSGTGLTGGQSVKLKVVAASGFTDQPVKWVTTSDGNNDPNDGEVDHGPQLNQDPADATTRGPCKLASLDPSGDPPHIGTTYGIAIDTDFPDDTYVIHKMSAEPADFLTDSDFSSFATSNPVPSGWNLTYNTFSGSLDENGNGSASIGIPDDGDLIGESLWLVLEVTLADESKMRGPPFKVAFVE